jgi:exodeoxyribonuclease-3
MKIATWNVNSIRSRLDRLLRWLERHEPDVLCLQELKVTDDKFPFDPIREAGYAASVHGQKTYNGVAILSRTDAEDICRRLDDRDDDPQARFISARINGLRVASVYVPNGSSVGSDKWSYKLAWLQRLRAHLDRHGDPAEPLVLCGDFNVAPHDLDVANPEAWRNTVLCHEDARQALGDLGDWGLVDLFRSQHPDGRFYSWWDYRMLGFPKNDGLRIDHILGTAPVLERLESAEIDRDERKGKQPSDHAPVAVVLTD